MRREGTSWNLNPREDQESALRVRAACWESFHDEMCLPAARRDWRAVARACSTARRLMGGGWG